MNAHLRRKVARALAAALLALTALAAFASPADAVQAPRVGWWNMATVAGVAAPAPTTPKGGMHIAAAPGEVLAFGAVLYAMPAGTTGRLTFKIANANGTVALQACPTKTVAWPAGDDQPSNKAPAYDCSITHNPGTVAGDGSTVTFTVDTFAPTAAGRLSLAIVPASSQPFSVDLDKPTAASLTYSSAPPPASSSTPTGVTAPTRTTSAASQPAPGRPLAMPAAPELPDTTASTADSAPAPQVAPSTPPTNPATAPVANRDAESTASTIGSVFGALAIVAALLFWGLGRGLLGGKIPALSSRLTPASASRRS